MIIDGTRSAQSGLVIRKAIIAAAMAVMLVVATPLRATQIDLERSHQSDERAVAMCIKRSAGGRIWLEKTLWGLRDQEGGWIGAEIVNGDGSHDLGPLQVNSWWVPRLAAITRRPEPLIRHWLKADPCFNVDAARWIFLSHLVATRDYWRAVGSYHSAVARRQNHYTQSVLLKLKRRFGLRVFQASQEVKR
jgi:hypothetical protein